MRSGQARKMDARRMSMYPNRIKELREDRDIPQREIAEYLQVAQNTYCNYENGVREIPIELLIRLSRFYQVNLEYLLGLTDRSAMLPPSKIFDSHKGIVEKRNTRRKKQK